VPSVTLDAFFPGEAVDFRFLVSSDGQNYSPVPAPQQAFFSGAGDYGYWKAMRYACQPSERNARFLKIEFQTEAQISRGEIDYGYAPRGLNKHKFLLAAAGCIAYFSPIERRFERHICS
jgi:hypothetical protein